MNVTVVVAMSRSNPSLLGKAKCITVQGGKYVTVEALEHAEDVTVQ